MATVKKVNTAKERERLATEAAMYMARALERKGLKVIVDTPEHAKQVYERVASEGGPERFSVGDLMRLNYKWDGEDISLRTFAQAFSDYIKQGDRTLEDAERIANAFLDAVAKDPASFVPQLKAENMSHARYFILNDGSVFGPEHPMFTSPEYQTQRGLVQIYSEVLGDEDFKEYLRLLDPSRVRTPEEDARFVAMEREVSGSSLMQRSLEVNAEKVNESRVKGIANLVQYFSNNPDYTSVEKALIVKGAMTWGVVEKKSGEANEVRIVRMTDSNDLSVPVIGGEAAAVVEGLRKGMNFKDALKSGREMLAMNTKRSVPGTFTGWKVYKQSDKEEDAAVLQQDAAGTGWCTGGALGTARSHLSGGDFHIYFEGGEPLIAIRTEYGRMAEPPRGAHEGQFCTDREEQIAFDYIKQGNSIEAGDDYVRDIEDIRRIMSPSATWRDAFMVPEERRYENGEFGGDTSAWGEAVEKRIDELMEGISEEERHNEGYFLSDEITDKDIPRVKYIADKLEIKGDKSYPNLQIIGGSLIIHDNATLDAPVLQSVGRCLNIWNNVNFSAPSLRSVRENLYIGINVSLNAPALQSVGWVLKVHENASLNAPALQTVGWDLVIDENASLITPLLQSVKGNLVVDSNASFDAPALQSVEFQLSIHDNASFEAPVLQRVSGNLVIFSNVRLPALQLVEGELDIWRNVSLDAPVLQLVRWNLTVRKNSSLIAPLLQSVFGKRFVSGSAKYVNCPKLGIVQNSFQISDGTVYGYALNGEIHLTPEGINPETPIHEYSHLWLQAYRKQYPGKWKSLCEVVEKHGLDACVRDDAGYSYLKDDRDAVVEETLCRIVGAKGGDTLRCLAYDAEDAQKVVDAFRKIVMEYAVTEVFGKELHAEVKNIGLAVLRGFADVKRPAYKLGIDIDFPNYHKKPKGVGL